MEPGVVDGKLLDEAARAYMAGDYDTAITAWTQVLEADPANSRAREGIKKVQMLRSDDGPVGDESVDPLLVEVQGMLDERRFEEAARLCRARAESAGPALRSAIHKLQQKAEHGRLMEPEIRRCMGAARRHLKEGNAREALPFIKQVLAMEDDHPVARRLMENLRDRVRKRSGISEPPAAPEIPVFQEAPAVPAPEDHWRGTAVAPPIGDSPARTRSGPESPREVSGDLDGTGPPAVDRKPLVSQEASRGGSSGLPEMDAAGAPGPDRAAAAGGPVSLQKETDEVVIEDMEPIALALEPEPGSGDEPGAAGASKTDFRIESPFQGGDGTHSGSDRPATSGPGAAGPDGADAGRPGGAPAPAEAGPLPLHIEDAGGQAEFQLPGREPERAAESLPAVRPARRGWGRGVLLLVVLGGVAGVILWWSDLTPEWLSTAGPSLEESVPAARAPGAGEKKTVDRASSQAETFTRAHAPAFNRADPPAAARRDPAAALELLEQGEDLFGEGRFQEAAELFGKAAVLDPVNPDIAAWQGKAGAQLEIQRKATMERDSALRALRTKDFETALRKLYRLQQKEGVATYEAHIATGWYNWGLQLLAAGNLAEADRKMDEVLAIQPQDEQALAVKELIADYIDRAKDRLFYTRIEGLHYRAIPE